MKLMYLFSVLTNNAVTLHYANRINCYIAGLMMTATALSVCVVIAIFEQYGLENLSEVATRFIVLLGLLQGTVVGCLFKFNRTSWAKQPRRQRNAWLTWFGLATAVTGLMLMAINVDGFTTALALQGVVFCLVSLVCYTRSGSRQ